MNFQKISKIEMQLGYTTDYIVQIWLRWDFDSNGKYQFWTNGIIKSFDMIVEYFEYRIPQLAKLYLSLSVHRI